MIWLEGTDTWSKGNKHADIQHANMNRDHCDNAFATQKHVRQERESLIDFFHG